MGEKRHTTPVLSPDALHWLLHDGPFPVGEARALAVLRINRTTLGRWLSGQVKVPHAARLVLEQLAQGIPPGGSDHWQGFRWEGDALVTPAGDYVAARRIEGLTWQDQYIDALKRRVAELEGVVESLARLGGSANDAVVSSRGSAGSVSRPTAA